MASQGNEQDNTDAKFDILFRGDIAPGNSIDQVKARVAESFKLDEAAVNQLFSGAVISLKRNIDRATAERIFQRLSDAGALANIVPSNKEPSKTAPLDKVPLDKVLSNSTSNTGSSHQPESDKQSEPDKQSETDKQSEPNNQPSDKAFTMAPLGSDVLEGTDKPEQEKEQQSIPVDHLGLEPVGSNIIEDSEGETIEPVTVDTSHLTLDLTPE
jgi:hypothetical protein